MARGTVTFVFDDGYQHILDDVVPVLEQHNFRGVFAIAVEPEHIAKTEGLPVAPVAKWLSLQQRGHEIAAHGVTHRAFPKLSRNELLHELREPQRALRAKTLVYPGGAYNDTVVKAAQEHYQAARTTNRGFAATPPTDPMQLPTFNYTKRNWSLLKANSRVLWAYLTGQWIIETYHIVSAEPSDREHSVPLDSFAKHLAFVAKLKLPVTTIYETVGHNHN